MLHLKKLWNSVIYDSNLKLSLKLSLETYRRYKVAILHQQAVSGDRNEFFDIICFPGFLDYLYYDNHIANQSLFQHIHLDGSSFENIITTTDWNIKTKLKSTSKIRLKKTWG